MIDASRDKGHGQWRHLQEAKRPSGAITFEQFSKLLRLPIPDNLDKTGGLARDMLVHKFIKKLKAAVLARHQAAEAAAATSAIAATAAAVQEATIDSGPAVALVQRPDRME